MKRRYLYRRVRYLGLIRNRSQLWLLCTAMNPRTEPAKGGSDHRLNGIELPASLDPVPMSGMTARAPSQRRSPIRFMPAGKSGTAAFAPVCFGGDTFLAGLGVHQLYGRAGYDVLVVDTLDASRILDLFNGGSGTDLLELHPSTMVASSSAFRAEFAKSEAVVPQASGSSCAFKTLGLTVQHVENVELITV